jgi:hypothetical protein
MPFKLLILHHPMSKCRLSGQHLKWLDMFFPPVLCVWTTKEWLSFDGVFSPSLFFHSSPCKNLEVSFHLFLVLNSILIFLISICFVFILFFEIVFHLVSFNFYIKFGPHLFYCCLFFLFFF